MLLTTCPNCGAKYNALPETLSVRQGRVMCGRCRTVFNAFESLERIEDADADEALDYVVVDPQSAEAHALAPLSEGTDALLSVEPTKADKALPADRRDDDALDSRSEAHRKLEMSVQIVPSDNNLYEATSAVIGQQYASSASGLAREPARSDEAPAKSAMPKALGLPIAVATDNPLIGGALPRSPSTWDVWTWLAAIAGAALILQSIYFYRSQIVQRYPQLRPAFTAACEVIGCSVTWGRDQAMIKIESSDLIEPPGRPGKMLLTATLANRAATKQDYPALEVKLTDASNAVITSRVLMPPEYLGRTPAQEEGLAPNDELYINLNLELVGKPPASGYGLRAFYH
ncbi:MAG: zinc-ribbon and DUF3426 domain-containing protein [Burkholderiales bacterium]